MKSQGERHFTTGAVSVSERRQAGSEASWRPVRWLRVMLSGAALATLLIVVIDAVPVTPPAADRVHPFECQFVEC